MKITIFALTAASLISASAMAGNRTYCGRMECSDAADGCVLTDGNTNPSILIETEANVKFNFVSDAMAKKIEALNCGCVTGVVALSSESPKEFAGPTFVYFKSVVSAKEVDESRCTAEGL